MMTIISNDNIGDDHRIPNIALWLGLAGLVPFVIGGLLALTGGMEIVQPDRADLFLIGYGAVILSFMAGIRWGLALTLHNQSDQALQMVVSIVPSLISWVALLLPFSVALPLLMITHAAQGVWDIRAMHHGRGPRWYGKLRMMLTSAAVAILFVVGLGRYFTHFGL